LKLKKKTTKRSLAYEYHEFEKIQRGN